MSKAVMETAAEVYRRRTAEKRKGESLIDVPCPSGTIFKCRKVTIPFLVTSGILPVRLVELLAKALEKGTVSAEDAFKALPVTDMLRSVEFAAKLVKYVCVEPRIVETPTEPNDLGQDELELDDFNHIVTWAMNGGAEAERLETFRTE